MSLRKLIEARGNILTKLERVPGIGSVARAMVHLSNAIKDPTIPGDFEKLNTFNTTPLPGHGYLNKEYGETQYDIVNRLNKKLGDRGIAYRYAQYRSNNQVKK